MSDLEYGLASGRQQQHQQFAPAAAATKKQNKATLVIFSVVFGFLVVVGLLSGFTGSSAKSHGPWSSLHGFCSHLPAISNQEFLARGVELQAAMRTHEADVFVTEPGASMTYFANLHWGLSERPFLFVQKASGPVHLLVPAFERETVEELLKGNHYEDSVSLHTWAETESPYKVFFEEILGSDATQRVFLDPQIRFFISHGIGQATGAPDRVRFAFDLIRELRMVKTPEELELMRCVNRGTKAAIRLVAGRLSESVTEDQATTWIREAFTSAGLTPAFALVAFGKNAAYPHGSNLRTTLKRGDFVLMDVGASLHGYVSDVTRTFPYKLEALSAKQREIWELVQQAQHAALAQVRPGVELRALDVAARQVIEEAGYGAHFGHRLGHGIGLEVHEEPYVVGNNDFTQLREGMTFSVEPGVYLVGELGVRHEDIVVVTADGYEVLGNLMESLENPFPSERLSP